MFNIILVILNEKFNVSGFPPVKFVSIKPSHNLGYKIKMMIFNETGRITQVS